MDQKENAKATGAHRFLWSVILILCLPVQWVHAIELGEVKLRSALNEILKMEINVKTTEDTDMLKVGLADAEYYKQANIPRAPILRYLKFSVQQRADGSTYILVTSTRRIADGFLTFFLDIHSPRGRVIKHISVLVDPRDISSRNETVANPTLDDK